METSEQRKYTMNGQMIGRAPENIAGIPITRWSLFVNFACGILGLKMLIAHFVTRWTFDKAAMQPATCHYVNADLLAREEAFIWIIRNLLWQRINNKLSFCFSNWHMFESKLESLVRPKKNYFLMNVIFTLKLQFWFILKITLNIFVITIDTHQNIKTSIFTLIFVTTGSPVLPFARLTAGSFLPHVFRMIETFWIWSIRFQSEIFFGFCNIN